MALRAHTTRQQLALYDDPHSEYCAKVKVVLHYKGLEWQTLPAGACAGGKGASQEFQQRVPLGKIPALVVTPCQAGHAGADDGQAVVLCESECINEFLEEAHPQPPMLPQEPLLRAQARLIARFHDLYLEPALRQLYPQVAPHTRSSAAVSAAGHTFLQHLQHLDKQLLVPGARLAVGDTLSLADCGYPGLLLYAQLLFPVLGLGRLEFAELGMPRVAAWHAALCEEPAVVKVLQELQPAAQQWLDSKLV